MTNIIQLDFDDLQAVIKSCLKEAVREINEIPKKAELIDRINLNEAIEITGLKKPTIYKLTMEGTIPHEKFRNGRLVFSREELMFWMEANTTRSQTPEGIATEQLAKVARKKLNKNNK
jgi:excisionase family DNA binding protein